MEEAADEGKLKAIGVANFAREDLDNILEHCAGRPVVNQVLCHIGNTPVDVKTKAPNELGLYDMSGNAYEWVDAAESGGYVKKGGSNYHSFRSEPYLYTPEGRYVYSSTDWTIGFRICLY